MKKSSNYWDKRALKRLTSSEKESEKYIKRIKKIYEQAFRNINEELSRVYLNYAKELISDNETKVIDKQKLMELLTRSETKKTWELMKKQGLDKYIKNNYKSRISRLEQIQAQIYAKAKLIYPKEELQNTMCYKGVINNSYYKTVYDTQMGTGYDFAFNTIDKNLVNKILNERWSGKNYSERIWTNTDILAESVSKIVGGALLSGQGIEKTTRQIRDRFNVSKYYAERLVRTETNHFNNEADAMAYEELGLDKYVFVATLDSRTSEICQSMDNKVFEYKKRQEGVNFPPLHPNCRSKTRAYLGEEAEKELIRRARNPITGKNEVIPNMSYSNWLKNKNITKNDIDKANKEYSISRKRYSTNDKLQYENYKKYFKEIEDIDNFVKIKYNNKELWEKYKKNYRVLNQYKLDNGTWSNEKVLELDEKAISFKRNELRSNEKRKGNIAIMEVDGNFLYAHSKLSEESDKGYKNLEQSKKDKIVLSQINNKYNAIFVDGYLRDYDSEYKLFNYLANTKDPKDTFIVNMLSERCMCESCTKVMQEFIHDYPNATINIVSNKRTNDPWKHRRRK